MFSWIHTGVGAIAGAAGALALAILYNTAIENPQVRSDERALVQAEARERALELIEKRSKDNEEISTFDMQQLCVELGGRWVQPDGCVD